MADLTFCRDLVDNFTEYCNKTYGYEKYPNQDRISCEAIVESCLDVKPDYVLDIGTNFGASTLSLAYGLKTLGKSLSAMTTIDYSLKHWREETPAVQKVLLEEHGIDPVMIPSVCADFQSLNPSNFVKSGKALVFYDIHDTLKHSFMTDFLNKWLPSFSEGSRIMVHDFSAVPKDFISPYKPDPKNPRSRLEHFSGVTFEGFMEVEILVRWLNERKKQSHGVADTSIMWFDL